MRVMIRSRQPAHTTPELLLVFTLLAILAAFAVPSLVRARDALSVRAARDAIVSAATRTRSLAMARGGAFLRVNEDGVIAVLARDTARVHSQWDLGQRYGITIQIENSSRTSALLEYDALGVGRLANLTVRVQRGQTAGIVTFSAYGRPRPW
jgi:Tfp pilus assembly protein FimT